MRLVYSQGQRLACFRFGDLRPLFDSNQGDYLWRRNYENDLAFRRVGLIMRKEFTGLAAPEFLEFFRQLSRNAKLPIWHDTDAGGQRLG